MMSLDLRELPAYTISEGSRYLRIPAATVRYWLAGRGRYQPLVHAATQTPLLLSFLNLVELHILDAIRRIHRVRIPKIRSAIDYLVESGPQLTSKYHPLISHEFATDGCSLFIERYGELINISQKGQIAMHNALGLALERIDRDITGTPAKLYPFTRNNMGDSPTIVVINPGISAGRPVLSGTGVATRMIFERYQAGESVKELAWDYERSDAEIEEAVRCEIPLAA